MANKASMTQKKPKYPRIYAGKTEVMIECGPECRFIVNALAGVGGIEVIGDHGPIKIEPVNTNHVRIWPLVKP
jgi:hypothetical protein